MSEKEQTIFSCILVFIFLLTSLGTTSIENKDLGKLSVIIHLLAFALIIAQILF